MRNLFLLAFLFLSACAKSGDSVVYKKSIFSIWTISNQSYSLDLSGKNFDTPIGLQFQFTSGQVCRFDLTFSGDQDSGTWTRSNASYIPNTGNGSDPGCSSLNDTGPYRRRQSVILLLCSPGETDEQCSQFY